MKLLVEQKTMTTKQLAESLGVDVKTIQRTSAKLFDNNVVKTVSNGGRPTQAFTESQATAIKIELQNHSKVAKNGFNTMTTREIADQLSCSTKTVRENAKKCLPNKVFENGKQTYWTEEEITLLVDFMQKNNNRTDLTSTTVVQASVTDLTPALMIKQAMELMNKGYQLELERIKAEKAKLETEKENLKIELDESKEWYSIKRMQKINPDIKFKYSLLKKESKKLGYGIKKVFDQNYGEVNAYHKKVYESLFFDTLDFE